MKRNFDLYVYNNLTNEIQIIRNFGHIYYSDEEVASKIFFIYIKDFIKNQIPFRVEMVFN